GQDHREDTRGPQGRAQGSRSRSEGEDQAEAVTRTPLEALRCNQRCERPGPYDDIGSETMKAPTARRSAPMATCHVNHSPRRMADIATTSTTLSFSTDTTPDTGPISRARK